MSDELVALVEMVSQKVVTVRNLDDDLSSGSGSGWLYARDVVVTNNHVIAGRDPVYKLRLYGGLRVDAELVGADRATDLAVLRAAVDLCPLHLSPTPARLGELCLAFGCPLGEYPETATLGIVSGLSRRLEMEDGRSIEGVLQTDAEINRGNSGGPLVNLDGHVLGVNTAAREDGRGIGFSVPTEVVASIVPELIEHGSVLRPRLGISVEVVDHTTNGAGRERLRVGAIPPGSPFHVNDLLVAIANRRMACRADLFNVLRRPLIGVSTAISVERDGEIVTFSVDLESPGIDLQSGDRPAA